jgi:general stress protein 26
MANIEKLKSNPENQLWEHLRDVRFVMLGSPREDDHMQPMAPHVDEEDNTVWFFTNKSSDLVEAVNEQTDKVHMCLVEDDYQACIRGSLSELKSQEVIDRFWSPEVAAWFEGGKADADLTLLKFKPDDAAIWASSKNPITFAWEVAKANVKGQTPDVGSRGSVDFKKDGVSPFSR